MSLKEQIYSVLIVSAAENLNIALTALLPESAMQKELLPNGHTTM